MKKYKALIIDDNFDNINILKIYLKKFCPKIEVIGEATNINEGIEKYVRTNPEILLLDIDLGDDTIFSFIDAIDKKDKEIIFISSHTEFAVKAVNCNITGFIVKPINITELQKKINRAVFNIETKLINSNKKLDVKKNEADYYLKIAIPCVNKLELISIESIMYLKSDGKYTVFYLKDNKEIVSSINLGKFEKILNSFFFFRIHHSFLVNVNMVNKVHKNEEYYCELINGKNIPIAKRRLVSFKKFLKLKYSY